MIMTGFDYFDRVYCIHMPNEERCVTIAREFERVGITDVQYIYAEPPVAGFHMSNMRRAPRGEFGCSLSHIKAAFQAFADGADRPLFLEDDVVFEDNAADRMRLVVRELDICSRWDILYMGGHPRSTCHRINENLVEIGTFSFAESYAINGDSLESWIEFWIDSAGQKNAMVDLVLGRWAAENNGYCVYPLLTHQPPGFSQITGRDDNKDSCLKKGWYHNLCREDRLCESCATSAIKSA